MIFPGGRGRVTSRNAIVPSPLTCPPASASSRFYPAEPGLSCSRIHHRPPRRVFSQMRPVHATVHVSQRERCYVINYTLARNLDSRPACCHCRRFRRRWWRRAASNRGTEIAPARADTERVPLQRYRGATPCNACPATQRDVRKVDVKEDLSLSCARARGGIEERAAARSRGLIKGRIYQKRYT